MPLILASASPRRREILTLLGLKFTPIASHVEERDMPGTPEEKARTWALLKAEAVAGQVSGGIIIGADTIVVIDDRILGKPQSEQAARRMLRLLSGRTHRVITGLALINAARGQRVLESVESRVSFRLLSEDEIDSYIATKEPMDKAGAYAIQGGAASFVTGITGCYTNVVGLPVSCLLASLARSLNITLLTSGNNSV